MGIKSPNKLVLYNFPPGEAEKQSLSPDFLQKVAACIHAKKWKAVFRGLMSSYRGSSHVDVLIGDIEANYPHDVVEKKYQALCKWMSTMGDKATSDILMRTLQKNGCLYDDGESRHSQVVSTTDEDISRLKQELTGEYMHMPVFKRALHSYTCI